VKTRERRGIGHVVVIVVVAVILIFVVWSVASYFSQRQLQSTYVSGTFQGYTMVNTGGGDQYIVKISNTTVTCDSWTMTTADIYTLTHLEQGQTVTMSLACSNIAVG